jgi:hypothetical protein
VVINPLSVDLLVQSGLRTIEDRRYSGCICVTCSSDVLFGKNSRIRPLNCGGKRATRSRSKALDTLLYTAAAHVLAYSPDLNPSDPSASSGGLRQLSAGFSTKLRLVLKPAALKQLLHKAAERTIDATWRRISALLDHLKNANDI